MVKDVPYVNAQRAVRRGILICKLDLTDDKANKPSDHVAFWTGEYAYTINLVLKDMIQRCRELDIRVSRPEKELEREAAIFLTMQTMKYLYSKKRRLAV